jgi:hypothetical protein
LVSTATARPRSWWRCALAAALPAAVVLLLIAARFGAGPRQFLPVWNDEVIYWNETAVFAAAGFEGGYITVHEFPAPVEFSRFGPHGPVFAIFHGTLAKIAGLRPYTAFLINLCLVTLAAFAWLRGSVAGPTAPVLLLLVAFWPLLLYLPTNMQEPTHFALAFLFALAIERQTRGRTRLTLVWTGVLLAVAMLLRPSWALLIPALGWHAILRRGGLSGAPRTHRATRIVALIAATVLVSAAASSAFDALASPSRISVHVLTSTVSEDPLRVPALVLEGAFRNVGAWFSLTEDRPPEVVFRYFTTLLLIVLAVRALAARPGAVEDQAAVEAALLAVAPAVAAIIGFGDVESWRDFRVLGPHVLIALLLLAATGRWERWLWAATLLFLPVCYQEFIEFHQQRFTADPAPIAAMQNATAPVMPFRRGASPWENTIAVPAELLQFPLLGLPPGIGISYVTDWQDMAREIRSRYLLLRPADRQELDGRVQMEPIAETPLGTLYRNQSVAGSR